jgi:hypothetical protein
MEFRNYVPAITKKKWREVVIFYDFPREHPTRSKEGKSLAKFIATGDAYEYAAKTIERAPQGDFFDWKLIVIR